MPTLVTRVQGREKKRNKRSILEEPRGKAEWGEGEKLEKFRKRLVFIDTLIALGRGARGSRPGRLQFLTGGDSYLKRY